MLLVKGAIGTGRAVTLGLSKPRLVGRAEKTFTVDRGFAFGAASGLPSGVDSLTQPAQRVLCVASTYVPVSQGPRDALDAGDFKKSVHVGHPCFELAASLRKPTEVHFACFTRGKLIELERHVDTKFFENIRVCYNGNTRTAFTVDGPPKSVLNLFDNARRSFVGDSPRGFQLKCSQTLAVRNFCTGVSASEKVEILEHKLLAMISKSAAGYIGKITGYILTLILASMALGLALTGLVVANILAVSDIRAGQVEMNMKMNRLLGNTDGLPMKTIMSETKEKN
uniref:ZP domain-containing protein n=1 Tax=Globodera pallida TaxID=36090 RepID=A0A183CD66_GLOPA